MGERARNCFLRFSAVSGGFLRLQTTYLADQGANLQKSAKIFDKLPFLPFSLSHLALPDNLLFLAFFPLQRIPCLLGVCSGSEPWFLFLWFSLVFPVPP